MADDIVTEAESFDASLDNLTERYDSIFEFTARKDNILFEKIWSPSYILGDWVKEIPQQLNVLWNEKDRHKVVATRRELLHNLLKMKALCRRSSVKLLPANELLLRVFHFTMAICKSDAVERGALLLDLIDFTWSLSERSVFLEFSNSLRLEDYMKLSNGDLKLLQGCTFLFLSCVKERYYSSGEEHLIMEFLNSIENCDELTETFIALAFYHIFGYFYSFPNEKLQSAICNKMVEIVERPSKTKSLAKVIAAMCTAQHKGTEMPAEAVNLIVDCHFANEYIELQKSKLIALLIPSLSELARSALPQLQPVTKIFVDRFLTCMEGISDPERLAQLMISVLEYVLPYGIHPQMKVVDLNPETVKVLTKLTILNEIWTIEAFKKVLAKLNLPMDKNSLKIFLQDTSATNNGITFPKFEGIEKIPWHSLRTFCGMANFIPLKLEQLVTTNETDQRQIFQLLLTSLHRQGSLNSCSSLVVPYLIQLLECSTTTARWIIIEHFLYSFLFSGVDFSILLTKYNGFDIDQEFPDPDNNPYCRIKHDVETNLMNGVGVYLRFLEDPAAELRVAVSNLLSLLPKAKKITVPLLKKQIESETDPQNMCEHILCLSLLYLNEECRDEYYDYFMTKWNSYKDSKEIGIRFSVFVALIRYYLGKKVPNWIIEEIIRALEDEELKNLEYIDTDHHLMTFMEEMHMEEAIPTLLKLSTTEMLVTAVRIVFRYELRNKKPVKASLLESKQIEVLQKVVDPVNDASFSSFYELLDTLGLPDSPEDLSAFIEMAMAAEDMETK